MQLAHLHREVVRSDGVGHADCFKARAADSAQPIAADFFVVQGASDVEKIVEAVEVLGDDGAGLAYDRFEQHRIAGNRRRMAHHAAHAGRGPAGLIDDHLLAVGHRSAYRLGEVQSVKILEALDVDADRFDFGALGEVAQQVAVREVSLVAQRQHVAWIKPGVLA